MKNYNRACDFVGCRSGVDDVSLRLECDTESAPNTNANYAQNKSRTCKMHTVSGSTTRVYYMKEKRSEKTWLLLQQKTYKVLDTTPSDSVNRSHCFGGGNSSFRINWRWRPFFSETSAHICQTTRRHIPENKSWKLTQNHTTTIFLYQLMTNNRKIFLRQITSRTLGHCCDKFVAFKRILAQNNIINEPIVVNSQPEGAGENIWT